MLPKKHWPDYSVEEIAEMRDEVIHAAPNTPFSPEYVAAYLGMSPSTLQKMRSYKTDGIAYSKIGGHVRYIKKNIDDYLQAGARGKIA